MLKVTHEIDDPDRHWSLFPLCLLSIAPDIYDNKQKNNKQVDFFQDSASIGPPFKEFNSKFTIVSRVHHLHPSNRVIYRRRPLWRTLLLSPHEKHRLLPTLPHPPPPKLTPPTTTEHPPPKLTKTTKHPLPKARNPVPNTALGNPTKVGKRLPFFF